MNSQNEEIVHQFYSAFQKKNAEGMINKYHQDIIFEDPAFGVLKGERAKSMWTMLCATATDLKINFEVLSSDGNTVEARWEAFYTFSRTGRKVHNKINASFIIENGEIVKHTDIFDLHKWATQAIGMQGRLLGWTGFFKSKLNQQTAKLLTRFMNETKSSDTN